MAESEALGLNAQWRIEPQVSGKVEEAGAANIVTSEEMQFIMVQKRLGVRGGSVLGMFKGDGRVEESCQEQTSETA